jgi:hypothetical protein
MTDTTPAERVAVMEELTEMVELISGDLKYVQGLLEDLIALGETTTPIGDGRLLPSTLASLGLSESPRGENNTERANTGGEENPSGPSHRHGQIPTSRPKHPWAQARNRLWGHRWGHS